MESIPSSNSTYKINSIHPYLLIQITQFLPMIDIMSFSKTSGSVKRKLFLSTCFRMQFIKTYFNPKSVHIIQNIFNEDKNKFYVNKLKEEITLHNYMLVYK